MKKALIACRTGMGSSMMLKIKVDQVVREEKLDLSVEHGTLSDVRSFNGDILITMSDVAEEYKDFDKLHVIGIKNLMDKDEIKDKLTEYFNQ